MLSEDVSSFMTGVVRASPGEQTGVSPPLRVLNSYATLRAYNTAKRKSAVEILQETKGFYVKTDSVRESRQQLRISATRASNHFNAAFTIGAQGLMLAPPTSHSRPGGGDQLQAKLRRLLDSKENLCLPDDTIEPDNRTQEKPRGRIKSRSSSHKSLPELPTSTPNRSESSGGGGGRCGGDGLSSSNSTSSTTSTSSSSSSSSSSDSSSSENGPSASSGCPSTPTQEEQSPQISPEHEKHRNRIDVGVSERLTIKTASPSILASLNSPSERSCWTRRPVLRSKSDVGQRLLLRRSLVSLTTTLSTDPVKEQSKRDPPDPEILARFFDSMGLDSTELTSLNADNIRGVECVFFPSEPSLDSASSWPPGERHPEPPCATQVSIVERNARVIKWLCSCRKATAPPILNKSH